MDSSNRSKIVTKNIKAVLPDCDIDSLKSYIIYKECMHGPWYPKYRYKVYVYDNLDVMVRW